MSERRCVCGLPWTDEHRAETKLHWEEPQEGAPSGANRSADLQDSAGVSTRKDEARGVPSCDPELEAIRERIKTESVYEDGGYLSLDEGRALLRMVDELTKQRDDYWHQYVGLESENVTLLRERNDAQAILSAVSKERDDLRAKLADAMECQQSAEKCWAQERTLREELEQKLAEAEKDREGLRVIGRKLASDWNAEHARAEAAEARVRELGQTAAHLRYRIEEMKG